MSDTECVPEHDVGVVDGAVVACLFDPHGQPHGGFAGSLGDVAAGGVDLVVLICFNVSKYSLY